MKTKHENNLCFKKGMFEETLSNNEENKKENAKEKIKNKKQEKLLKRRWWRKWRQNLKKLERKKLTNK